MPNSRGIEITLDRRLEELGLVADSLPLVSLEDLLTAMLADPECRRIACDTRSALKWRSTKLSPSLPRAASAKASQTVWRRIILRGARPARR